jgi:hypothetical protein
VCDGVCVLVCACVRVCKREEWKLGDLPNLSFASFDCE